jgi:1-acyl-sn-glycerol-3-phosphate acyltransferase
MTVNTLEKATKTAPGYYLLSAWASFIFHLFYKRIYVFGKENIPKGCPVIYAPNHQNAVMDPLAVLFTQRRPTVFLARADVFKGKRTASFLASLKILPVYRQRDGVENLSKNDGVFDATVKVLKENKPVCLMAEGNHGNQNKLRPLVKGMFRIALSAQESIADKQKGVQIVPVGLYYHDYAKFNQKLVVNYGKPISIDDYYERYKEKPALTLNQLRADLAEKMSEQMIDIQTDTYYNMVQFVQSEFSRERSKKKPKDQFWIQKQLCDGFNRAIAQNALFLPQLLGFVNEYTGFLKQHDLRDWVVEKGKFPLWDRFINFMACLVLFPFLMFGGLINWLPFTIPAIPTKKIKDRQFHSSVKYALSIFVFPIYYLIIGLIAWLMVKSVFATLAFLTFSALSGFIALKCRNMWVKLKAKTRFEKLNRTQPDKAHEIIKLRYKIMLLAQMVYNNAIKQTH